MPTRTLADYPLMGVVLQPSDIPWIFSGEFALLDNFADTPVAVDLIGEVITYPTSEHAYAAAKSCTDAAHLRVARQRHPGIAKAVGRAVPLREDWEQVKFDVMWRVLVAKFAQHPDARAVLRSTGDRRIFEGNTWDDRVWGVVKEPRRPLWTGRNALGCMLMELRANYFG